MSSRDPYEAALSLSLSLFLFARCISPDSSPPFFFDSVSLRPPPPPSPLRINRCIRRVPISCPLRLLRIPLPRRAHLIPPLLSTLPDLPSLPFSLPAGSEVHPTCTCCAPMHAAGSFGHSPFLPFYRARASSSRLLWRISRSTCVRVSREIRSSPFRFRDGAG